MSDASVNPPEELLTQPSVDAPASSGAWLVVARNRRVNRDWEALVDRSPENALRWYKYLRQWPITRYPAGCSL